MINTAHPEQIRAIVPHPDFFTVHRYAIFYEDGTERRFASLTCAALSVVRDPDADGVTDETPGGTFYDAEDCRKIYQQWRIR